MLGPVVGLVWWYMVLPEDVCHWDGQFAPLASCLAQSVSFQLPINASVQPLWSRIPLNHISSLQVLLVMVL